MGAWSAQAMKSNEVLQMQRGMHLIIVIASLISMMCVDTVCSRSGFSYPHFDSFSEQLLLQSPANTGGPEWTTDTVLLTPDPTATVTQRQLHNVGRILCNHSFPFMPPTGSHKEVFSFNTSFTFKIVTTSSYGKCGDGLAFVITGDKQIPLNSSGRYLGLASQIPSKSPVPSPFFAVEFDTFQNRDAGFDDPSASHIGININSLESLAALDTSGNNSCCTKEVTNDTDNTHCPQCDESDVNVSSNKASLVSHGFYPELFLYSNYTFTAWVEYDASTPLIQVWMTNQSTDQRPAAACLSVPYNLSKIFQSEMYVGISAASGNNFQGNTLYSWNFTIDDKVQTKGTWHRRMLISIAVAGTTLAIIGGAVCILATAQRRKRDAILAKRRLERLPRMEMGSLSMSMQRYTYKDLKRAVKSFNEKAKVGEGGFSTVYKGVLKDGTVVAVKRLKDGVRMEAEFTSEVQIISQIRHRNLLQLQGWCYEKGEALLVYQFMTNGSLDSYLFGDKKASHCLDSDARIKVLMGVAAALEYLHGGLGGCVLHRDVKAANVLLSDKFEALLGDFGLARLITHDQVVTMTAAGTPGYVAPEVIYTGKATDKADVYSFGVLALEVACGRRALDPSHDVRLLDWVWTLHQSDTITNALDPTLNLKPQFTFLQEQEAKAKDEEDGVMQQNKTTKVFDEFKWQCVLHLGLLCCHPCPDIRPTMRQVHQVLQETTLLTLPPFRPMYPTSYDLSTVSSNLSCTYSLGHSAPCLSDGLSINSPLND